MFVFFRELRFTNNYTSVIVADAALTLPFCILICAPAFCKSRAISKKAALNRRNIAAWRAARVIVPNGPQTIGEISCLRVCQD